jgi:hypothetical protein
MKGAAHTDSIVMKPPGGLKDTLVSGMKHARSKNRSQKCIARLRQEARRPPASLVPLTKQTDD